jgi:hypothetical protein
MIWETQLQQDFLVFWKKKGLIIRLKMQFYLPGLSSGTPPLANYLSIYIL